MTTHDLDKIIAAAKKARFYIYEEEGFQWLAKTDDLKPLERFYTIAFEAGRKAEREECAQILEKQDVDPSFKHRMADAIRARGEVK